MTARIERIEMLFHSEKSIRVEWSNDRHQDIKIKSDNVSGVIKAFEDMIYLLREERANREI